MLEDTELLYQKHQNQITVFIQNSIVLISPPNRLLIGYYSRLTNQVEIP